MGFWSISRLPRTEGQGEVVARFGAKAGTLEAELKAIDDE
jgi:hypothetical protein